MSSLKKLTEHPLVSLSNLQFLLRVPRKDLQQIAERVDTQYFPFDIHKNGTDKWRHIDNPKKDLKTIQKRILVKILKGKQSLLPEGMTGGITGKSVVKNAKKHVKKECVAVIDIKECFPNTDHMKIYAVWKNFFGCGKKTIWLLTRLTTFQDRLPQGAPTSSLLCNFALVPIFKEIHKYTEENNLSLSIFVDDITISGNKKNVETAIPKIIEILKKHRYAVRNKKIKVITNGFRQKTTGVTINNKLSIGRNEINEIRDLILETSKLKDYLPSNVKNTIYGKISFAKYVSKTQGAKLEEFANELLIAPILPSIFEKDLRRNCKRYNRNHTFSS